MGATRGRPGRKATATRARILDAAAQTFRDRGYVGTRLSDVAAAAQTHAGSLYYHFSSREALVEEVLRVGHERTSGYVQRRVAELPADHTAIQGLCAAIGANLEAALEVGDYTSATIRIFSQVPQDIRERRLIDQRVFGEFWRTLVADAQSCGEMRPTLDASVVRMFLLGGMNSVSEWFRPRKSGLTARQLAHQVETLFVDGIAVVKDPSGRGLDIELAAFDRASSTDQPAAPRTEAAQRILTAAAEVFRDRGYAGTRLADVAAAANIQTGSLYHHFSSREDLVAHLVLTGWEHTNSLVRASVAALPGDATPLRRLTTAAVAHLRSVAQRDVYTSALVRVLGQVPPAVREVTVAPQREFLRYWRELFQDTVNAGQVRADLDVPAAVMLLHGTLNWSVEWYDPDGRLALDDLGVQLVTLVLDGIRA